MTDDVEATSIEQGNAPVSNESTDMNVLPPLTPTASYVRIGGISAVPNFVPYNIDGNFYYRSFVSVIIMSYNYIAKDTRQDVVVMRENVDLNSFYKLTMSNVRSLTKILNMILLMSEMHKDPKVFNRTARIDLEKNSKEINDLLISIENIKNAGIEVLPE